MERICKNCKSTITQNYCPNCGQPAILKRIDGQYIYGEIRNLLNFEKGILFTIVELTIRPGKSTITFLTENRNRLVKPIVFLIISSLIYSVLNNFIHFEDNYMHYSGNSKSAVISIFNWIQVNYGYANIIMAVFIGMWLRIIFKKNPFNFFEILILLCFVMGMGMLIYSFFGILESLTHARLMQVGVVIGFIYMTYAIGEFFDKRKLMSYIKSFFGYLLGMITFFLIAAFIGIAIDLIIK